MALIKVDAQKCVNDGLCQTACPGALIDIDDDGLPRPVLNIENDCIRCGHCVAICPTDALLHIELPQNEFVEIKNELVMGPEAVKQLIKSRRSIRNYLETPVQRELIEKVIDIARFAPTGHNDQDVQYSVFDKGPTLKSIADSVIDYFRFLVDSKLDQQFPFDLNVLIDGYEKGDDVILRGAPVLIVAHGLKVHPMTSLSSNIALTTLELAAFGLGLGTCWAGFVMLAAMSGYKPLLNVFALPEDQQFCSAMILGYPQLTYRKIPVRKKPIIYWRD